MVQESDLPDGRSLAEQVDQELLKGGSFEPSNEQNLRDELKSNLHNGLEREFLRGFIRNLIKRGEFLFFSYDANHTKDAILFGKWLSYYKFMKAKAFPGPMTQEVLASMTAASLASRNHIMLQEATSERTNLGYNPPTYVELNNQINAHNYVSVILARDITPPKI